MRIVVGQPSSEDLHKALVQLVQQDMMPDVIAAAGKVQESLFKGEPKVEYGWYPIDPAIPAPLQSSEAAAQMTKEVDAYTKETAEVVLKSAVAGGLALFGSKGSGDSK